MMQYLLANQVILIPLLKATISIDKYDPPTKVIVFLETGALSLMINPIILPPNHWQETHRIFKMVNGEVMKITKISKVIQLKLFLDYEVQHKFYRSFILKKIFLSNFIFSAKC